MSESQVSLSYNSIGFRERNGQEREERDTDTEGANIIILYNIYK